MLRAFERAGVGGDQLCTYCIGGQHPFVDFIPVEQLKGTTAQLKLLGGGE
jgi:hypothetical protein